MYSLSCIRKSPSSLLRFYGGLNQISQLPSKLPYFSGCLENFKSGSYFSENVARGESVEQVSQFSRNLGMDLGLVAAKGNASAPYALNFRSFIHSTGQKDVEIGRNFKPMDFTPSTGQKDIETERNSRPMDFVRGIMEEDRVSHLSRYNVEQNADFVHIKFTRNNTFVTVTDSKGNTKIRASVGVVQKLNKGTKLSRYAAEATAEHVGRKARNLGLKSVVMKVKGFTYFKKKRQAIMSFRDGFTNSRSDQNPVVYIEDTTRRPHNGCRLPKKRRV